MINTITTAVVEINADVKPTQSIKIGAAIKKGHLTTGARNVDSNLITPFFSNAQAIIIRFKMVMTAGFANPEMASSGFTSLNAASKTIIPKDVLSIGKSSSANMIIEAPRMQNKIIISIDI
ncbi:hypothetical protein GCM10007940_46710 [Portibacter lacus]|uniref:Uncharacterized protein n=1 Tax=Portibacter lacus TaxID=1099794 RepID=A0AA37WIP2_9BACT|nr:hypothetical protein GCM10007940_46710 [Portibacter lacus]